MHLTQLIIILFSSIALTACGTSYENAENQIPPSADRLQEDAYATSIGAYYLYEKNDPKTAETYFALVDSSVTIYQAFVAKTPGHDLIDLGHYYIFVDEKPELALDYFNKAYEFDPSGASLSAIMAYNSIPDSDEKTKGLIYHLESLTTWLPEYCLISERCHNLYYIPVKLAHIYVQPDTKYTDIPKAYELLDFAEDILVNTEDNLSTYSLDKRLHFYACVKPNDEKHDYWSAKAIEIGESNLLPTSCDDPLVPSFEGFY